MELQQKRHQVLPLEAAGAPKALPLLMGCNRVQVKYLIALGIRLAGGRVGAWHRCQQRGMPGFLWIFHVPDLQPRVLGLNAIHQCAGGQHRPLARRVIELGVEPLIQLVMKGQDTPGQPGQQQEHCGGQAHVAVQ